MKEIHSLTPTVAGTPPDHRLSRRALMIWAAAVAGLGSMVVALPAEAQSTTVECLADLMVS
ncbi:hypothetical protein OG474_03760 [Kribbella sp. NBC_01505]|uniref:hypothetical protein n=1 Tax=Kribbella sp. NBC_01505 TaxID=2903580 RepID=UPI0038647C96